MLPPLRRCSRKTRRLPSSRLLLQLPPQEELRVSSFRFTWEQQLPAWYRDDTRAAAGEAQLLIAGDPAAPLPEKLALQVGLRAPDGVFARDAIFRFRTHVSVWLSPAP